MGFISRVTGCPNLLGSLSAAVMNSPLSISSNGSRCHARLG
jgi:hypothetical protein